MALRLVGADRYAIERLPQLEAYVDEQVATSSFNLEANLALLRLYQFNPASIKVPVVARVLLKALTQLPALDYKACLHLLPERLQSEDAVAKVMEMASALESGRFADFWLHAASSREMLGAVPGFYESVRGFAVHLLSITYQKVPKKVLADAVKMEGDTLETMIQQRIISSGWSVIKSRSGDLIVLPKNEHNQAVVKRTQDVITFDQVAPVLKAITAGF